MKDVKFTQQELLQKINTEEDFVNSHKYSYSLLNVIEKNPNGVTDRWAASLLAMSVEEFKELWESAIKEYRHHLKVDVE